MQTPDDLSMLIVALFLFAVIGIAFATAAWSAEDLFLDRLDED